MKQIRFGYKCGHNLLEKREFETEEDHQKYQAFTRKHKNCPKCIAGREELAAGTLLAGRRTSGEYV